MKVFLLKFSDSEYIVINNITFTEDAYQLIKSNVGEELLIHIDVVFRTLRVLVDNYWTSALVTSSEDRVGWRGNHFVQKIEEGMDESEGKIGGQQANA